MLFDHGKPLDVGGFSWQERLPPEHAGEEVIVQFLLVRKHSGYGILPSGTHHIGPETAVDDRRHNATKLFSELTKAFTVRPLAQEVHASP